MVIVVDQARTTLKIAQKVELASTALKVAHAVEIARIAMEMVTTLMKNEIIMHLPTMKNCIVVIARIALKMVSKVCPGFMITNCRCVTWKTHCISTAFWVPNVTFGFQVDITSAICCCMHKLTYSCIGLKTFHPRFYVHHWIFIPQAMDTRQHAHVVWDQHSNASKSSWQSQLSIQVSFQQLRHGFRIFSLRAL